MISASTSPVTMETTVIVCECVCVSVECCVLDLRNIPLWFVHCDNRVSSKVRRAVVNPVDHLEDRLRERERSEGVGGSGRERIFTVRQ